jgi:hypothetical protein
MILVNSTRCSLNVKFLSRHKITGLAKVADGFEGILNGILKKVYKYF